MNAAQTANMAVSMAEAIERLSEHIDRGHMDAFEASIHLAYVFGIPKERAIDLIIGYGSGT